MDAHAIKQLSSELEEFMETIIAQKGKTYGNTLSVWLTFIALERMHLEIIRELVQAVSPVLKNIPLIMEIYAVLDSSTQRLQAGLHETIHISGNLMAQERGKNITCSELEEELRADVKMFLRKELEYHAGKKGTPE